MEDQSHKIIEYMGFDDEVVGGRMYNFYEQAVDGFWDPRDINLEQDKRDWENMTQEQRETVLEIVVNFFIGEQRVAEEIPPLVYAAYRQGRFDWVAHLSAFQFEEVKHAQLFEYWLSEVFGTLEPEELVPHLHLDLDTTEANNKYDDPTWLIVTKLPTVMEELMEANLDGDYDRMREKYVEGLATYNVHQEGIAAQPSYRIIIDTCEKWDVLPGLKEGYKRILQDEARHVGGSTRMINELIEEDPELESVVRDVLEGRRESLIGFISYQLANPELNMQKYKDMKSRQYQQRCSEMGIEPDESLIEELKDPKTEFVRQ